jgi:hypothetical protein
MLLCVTLCNFLKTCYTEIHRVFIENHREKYKLKSIAINQSKRMIFFLMLP